MKSNIQNLSFLEPIFGYIEEVSVNSLYFNSKLEGKTLEFTLFQSDVLCIECEYWEYETIIFHLIMKIYYDLI